MSDSENPAKQEGWPEAGLGVIPPEQMRNSRPIKYIDRDEALKIARQIFVTNAELFRKLAELERNQNS